MHPDKRKDHLRVLYDLDLKDLAILTFLLDDIKLRSIAREIFLTPPAVSHRLRRLEETFGVELLVRRPGSAALKTLTPEGVEIATVAKRALDGVIIQREVSINGAP